MCNRAACVLSLSVHLSPHPFLLVQLLNAIQLFGANLDDYLHLLLPPIVKLFDAPDVPLQARKSVPHAVSSERHILPPLNEHKLTFAARKEIEESFCPYV